MRWSVLFGSAFLVSCATAQSSEPVRSEPKLRSVGAEVKSWGVTLRSWSVDAEGRVEHLSGGKPGANPADVVIEVRRLVLPQGSRRELETRVEAVRTVLSAPEHCDQQMTDGAYGTFRWDEGAGEQKLPFSANCVKGRDANLAEAIFAADKIVDDAAKAVEPVERRPYTQER